MPTITGKTFASFYKNLLGINQSSNTGVDVTTRAVQDGAGNRTAISLSDDVLSVHPITDDTTGTMLVKNLGGSNILAVDTTNSRVLVGSSQRVANTQYQKLSAFNLTPAAGYHYPLGLGGVGFSSAGLAEDTALGNGTDPATTLDISGASSESNAWVQYYWHLPDAITISSATVLMGGTSASDSEVNFHIMSYDMDVSSNHGDLSNGAVVASSIAFSAVDEDVIFKKLMTINSADVAAGKVLIGTLESNTTQILSIQMNVTYFIQ